MIAAIALAVLGLTAAGGAGGSPWAAPANLFTRGALADALVTTGTVLAQQHFMAEAKASTSRGVAIAATWLTVQRRRRTS